MIRGSQRKTAYQVRLLSLAMVGWLLGIARAQPLLVHWQETIEGDELAVQDIVANSDGTVLIAGHFTGTLTVNEWPYQSTDGSSDLFFIWLDGQQQILSVSVHGGPDDETLTAMVPGASEEGFQYYVMGERQSLTDEAGFVLEVLAQEFEGGQERFIGVGPEYFTLRLWRDLAFDPGKGVIYLVGSAVQANDGVVVSMPLPSFGNDQTFVNSLWHLPTQITLNGGMVRGERVRVLPDGDLIIAGVYQGDDMVFGSISLPHSSADEHLYLAHIQTDGPSLTWLGPIEDPESEFQFGDLALSPDGDIAWFVYADGSQGFLAGIETATGNLSDMKLLGEGVAPGASVRPRMLSVSDSRLVVGAEVNGQLQFPLSEIKVEQQAAALLIYDCWGRDLGTRILGGQATVSTRGLALSMEQTAWIAGGSVDSTNIVTRFSQNPTFKRYVVQMSPEAPVLSLSVLRDLIFSYQGFPYVLFDNLGELPTAGAWLLPSQAALLATQPTIQAVECDYEIILTNGAPPSSGVPSDRWWLTSLNDHQVPTSVYTHPVLNGSQNIVLYLLDGDPRRAASSLRLPIESLYQGRPTIDTGGSGNTAITYPSQSISQTHAVRSMALAAGPVGATDRGVAQKNFQVRAQPVDVFPEGASSTYVSYVGNGLSKVFLDLDDLKPSVVMMPLITVARVTPNQTFLLQNNIQRLIERGASVVVSAGNMAEAVTVGGAGFSPAQYGDETRLGDPLGSGVIVVAATQWPVTDRWVSGPSAGSNYGPEVTLWAPGQDICYNDVRVSGTSLSCALVAGAVLNVRAASPLASPVTLKSYFASGAGSVSVNGTSPPITSPSRFLKVAERRYPSVLSYADWKVSWSMLGVSLSPLADPDGDQLVNVEEFLFQSNPGVADDFGLEKARILSDGRVEVDVPLASYLDASVLITGLQIDGVTLRLEKSTDLSGWSDLIGTTVEPVFPSQMDLRRLVLVRAMLSSSDRWFFRFNAVSSAP